MITISPQVRTSIIIYILAILAILLKKRDLVFNNEMRLIPFGFNRDQSILSLPVITFVLAVLAYYLVSRFDINLV